MNVWIINPFDNLPAEGYRAERFTLMAEAFRAAGHTATHWTMDFSHALKRPRTIPPPPGVRFIHSPPYPKNICLSRLWAHRTWARNWRIAAEREPSPPDLVVVSSPPISICSQVRQYCRRRNIPYIIDVMDAWPETFERVVPRWTLAPLRRIAAANYRHASKISVVASRYLALVQNDYKTFSPVRLFYHGIATTPSPLPAPPAAARTLVYIGNMSASYDLATLLDAMRLAPEWQLHLAGSGPDESALRRIAPPNAIFHGYLSARDLRHLLSTAAAGIVPMFASSCVGIPYKLGDYAAASLPAISCLEGETRDLLSRYGAGVHYQARNASALANVLHSLSPERIASMREGMRRLARLFDASAIYPAYVEWALAAP